MEDLEERIEKKKMMLLRAFAKKRSYGRKKISYALIVEEAILYVKENELSDIERKAIDRLMGRPRKKAEELQAEAEKLEAEDRSRRKEIGMYYARAYHQWIDAVSVEEDINKDPVAAEQARDKLEYCSRKTDEFIVRQDPLDIMVNGRIDLRYNAMDDIRADI
jgi:hypothetical protein